jgi:3-phosphoshikimate 1-carboxyvinyltransferase
MDGIMVDASGFFPHSMEIDASLSSQFVSSLLMMLSLLGDSNLKIKVTGKEVSAGYVDITQDCLAKFGVNVKREGNEYYVTGKLRNPESQIEVESDMSSSSFLVTMGVLSSRGCIHLLDVVSSGIQPDHHYVDALSRAGFKVKYNASERTIDSCLSNGDTITVDVDRNPDLAPIASVIGILNSNGVVLKNTLRLTWKESDRRGEIIRLAESFGASVTEDGYDIMIKKGSNPLKPDKLIFNDHRMTMAATVASIASGSETIVGDLDSVKKSYPSFLNDLSSLGVRYSDVT